MNFNYDHRSMNLNYIDKNMICINILSLFIIYLFKMVPRAVYIRSR